MLPLNYAILKFFTETQEADVAAVMDALRPAYAKFRTFRKNAVTESLMTAEANGLLEEARIDSGADGGPRIFYRVTDYGLDMIRRFIG